MVKHSYQRGRYNAMQSRDLRIFKKKIFLSLMSIWLSMSQMVCSHSLPFTWVDDLPAEALAPEAYRIQMSDNLAILVWNQPKLSGEQKVRPDGQITLPLIGDIAVVGLTPTGVSQQIERRLDGLVVDPKVTVTIKESAVATYSVVGEVKTSGSFPLTGPTGVLQAIAASGGLTDMADSDRIFVLRKIPSIQRIRFSYQKLRQAAGRGILFQLREGDVVVVED